MLTQTKIPIDLSLLIQDEEFLESHPRNRIKNDLGILRGSVQETNIVPRSIKLFDLSQQEFGRLGQKIHSRRNKASFKSCDESKSDARK